MEDRIRQLAELGWGRTRIMREVPEASEYLIRKIIAEVNSMKELPNSGPTFNTNKPARHFDVVANLRPIQIKAPAAPKVKRNPEYQYTVAILGDVHAPFHHEQNVKAARAVLEAQREIRLDEVILLGDVADFYTISRYDKSPLRRNQLQDELTVVGDVIAGFTESAGDARKRFCKGNHEARLEDYIARNAPALAALPQLQLPSLLGLESAGWEYDPNYVLVKDSFIVKHGEAVSAASGASAKKELESTWMSGASGHVHRLAVHTRTSWAHYIKDVAPAVWVETGCLCRPDQDYLKGSYPNWQPGFAFVRFDEDGNPYPELVHLYEGRTMFNGKMIDVG